MSELHQVGVSEESRAKAERLESHFLEAGLLDARKKSWDVLHKIKARVQEGMTEREAMKMAFEVFKENGVNKHWHKPYVRFGPGTALSFNDPLQSDYRLQKDDPFYIDLGPAWLDEASGIEYEGDVGDTFVFGTNEEAAKCIEMARQLFDECKEEWKARQLTGTELYSFLRKRAAEEGYTLKEKVEGHRLSDYPHAKYTSERLAVLPFTPSPSFWVLEVELIHRSGTLGAFYEDLLY